MPLSVILLASFVCNKIFWVTSLLGIRTASFLETGEENRVTQLSRTSMFGFLPGGGGGSASFCHIIQFHIKDCFLKPNARGVHVGLNRSYIFELKISELGIPSESCSLRKLGLLTFWTFHRFYELGWWVRHKSIRLYRFHFLENAHQFKEEERIGLCKMSFKFCSIHILENRLKVLAKPKMQLSLPNSDLYHVLNPLPIGLLPTVCIICWLL